MAALFRAKIAAFRQDPNFTRAGSGIAAGLREFRADTGRRYFSNKVPVVQWISAYVPKWIIEDVTAGLSVGILLIPQSLAYSAVAGVSIQHAVMSSWLPGLIYAVMGTSKDISTGPTLSLSLLTAEIAATMPQAGSPAVIGAALSFCVGIWSLIFGFLNLGFIFDFISLPMLLGFTAGISYIAIMTQIPSILGLGGVTPVLIDVTTQVIAKLSEVKPITFGIGATSILLLAALQFIGKKWGQKNDIIRIIMIQRNLFVLILYTVISYEVNKDREEPLWLILGATRTEIRTLKPPDMQLVQTLLLLSIKVWVATSVEHVCLAKAFGYVNGYTIDQSQELVYLGVVNIANSMIGGIPVGGGDMARASVNSASGVRSPLSGLFTSILVMVAMSVASGLIKWIPQATVAAVIIVSVIDQMPPMAYMWKYWTMSFMDFLGFLVTFNMTMLLTAEAGIGLSFGAMVIYTFFRLMFPALTVIESTDLEDQYDIPAPLKWEKGCRIPEGTLVISVETDVIFVNAERIKRHVLNSVMTSLSGVPASRVDRAWNSRRDKHAEFLRGKAGINIGDTFYPRFRVLVLDLSSASFVDSTGMQAFEDIKTELRLYGGPDVQFRLVGMNEVVQTRFKRAGWKLASPYDDSEVIVDDEEEIKDLLFEHLPLAIHHQVEINRASGSERSEFEYEELAM